MSNFLPNALIRKLGSDPFFDQEAFLKAHQKGQKTAAILLNPAKGVSPELPLASKIPWSPMGHFQKKELPKSSELYLRAGGYLVMDSSEQFIAHIIQHIGLRKPGKVVLDVSASMGEKSVLLNTYLDAESVLVCNVSDSKKNINAHKNIKRWGSANVLLSNNDSSAFLHTPAFFDLVLMDSSQDNETLNEDLEPLSDRLYHRQQDLCLQRNKKILGDIIASIKASGYLLLSSNTYSKQQNEDFLDWILDNYSAESIPIPTDISWRITGSQSDKNKAYGYHFYPHQTPGLGFFAALIQIAPNQEKSTQPLQLPEGLFSGHDLLDNWLSNPQHFQVLERDGDLYFFPKKIAKIISNLDQVLTFKSIGTKLGRFQGECFIPSAELALSIHLSSKIACIQLSLKHMLAFTTSKTIKADCLPNKANGWYVLKYENISFAFIHVSHGEIDMQIGEE